MKTNKEIKVRRNWTINPVERIHGQGKKQGYDRRRQNRDWRSEMD
jgi:hypothetical protein